MSKPNVIGGYVPSNVKRQDIAWRSWVRINRVRRSFFILSTQWFKRIESGLCKQDTEQLLVALSCTGNMAVLPADLNEEITKKMILEYGVVL
jgi:hypothetical protein